MSELTRCNFCRLRDMRAAAKKRGARVTVTQGKDDWTGWLVVKESDEPLPSAFFKALGNKCEC